MFIKPLDKEILNYVSSKNIPIIIYEESSKLGGFGSSVLEYFIDSKISTDNITLMGIEDIFVNQGTKEEILKELNLDVKSIIKVIQKLI